MSIPLPPQVIALLPLGLDFLEKQLDRMGWLGFPYVVQRLSADKRAHFRDTFVLAGRPNGMLNAIAGYFEYEDTATDVIRSHIALLLSLLFALITKSRDLLKLEGWPVLALVGVAVSLGWFLFDLILVRPDPAIPNVLKPWSRRVWWMFVAILIVEASELLLGGETGDGG